MFHRRKGSLRVPQVVICSTLEALGREVNKNKMFSMALLGKVFFSLRVLTYRFLNSSFFYKQIALRSYQEVSSSSRNFPFSFRNHGLSFCCQALYRTLKGSFTASDFLHQYLIINAIRRKFYKKTCQSSSITVLHQRFHIQLYNCRFVKSYSSKQNPLQEAVNSQRTKEPQRNPGFMLIVLSLTG